MVYCAQDSQFTRRKKIHINSSADGALTDYQIKLTIAYESEMQADFDDIRFYETDGSSIYYWLESKTDSITADVWIKTDVPASGGKDIWIYYGNSTLSDGSDGSNVFTEFWDFEDNTLQGFSAQVSTAVTSTRSKRGTYSVDLFDNSSSSGQLGALSRSDFNHQEGILEYDLWLPELVGGVFNFCDIRDGATRVFSHYIYTATEVVKYYSSGAFHDYSNGPYTFAKSTWQKVSHTFKESTSLLECEIEGTDLGTGTRHNAGTIDTLCFSSASSAAQGHFGWIDDIRLRKYTANEPTTSIGTEQHQRRTPQFIG